MSFRICVISTFNVYDPVSKSFTTQTKSQVFSSLVDVSDYIRGFDYPPKKISIHFLSH